MQQLQRASLILSLGLAFTFVYLGAEKYLRPEAWLQWIPPWLEGTLNMDRAMWLKVVAGTEVTTGLLILFPLRTIRRAASMFMVLHMLIVIWQTGVLNDVGARDVSILAGAVALSTLL